MSKIIFVPTKRWEYQRNLVQQPGKKAKKKRTYPVALAVGDTLDLKLQILVEFGLVRRCRCRDVGCHMKNVFVLGVVLSFSCCGLMVFPE